LDEYDALLRQQEGRCAVCLREPGSRRLAVDHDHDTGSVRGLLCFKCNRAVGCFNDDPSNCLRAAEYLTRTTASRTSGRA
jgi:hypothetical protein